MHNDTLFSYSGTLGRWGFIKYYFLGFFALTLLSIGAGMGIGALTDNPVLAIGVGGIGILAVAVGSWGVVVRRARDVLGENTSGWTLFGVCVSFVIPFLNFITLAFLIFKKGEHLNLPAPHAAPAAVNGQRPLNSGLRRTG